MKTIICAAALAAAFAVSGCATKTYGRSGALTQYESTSMTCREIDMDMARTRGFTEEVKQESRFSGKDVLAFLGDFGIGNHMEKSAALESADRRLVQLQNLSASKGCTSVRTDAGNASS